MLIDVHLLNTETGERRVFHDDYDWPGKTADAGVSYKYGMGNYSCDCNRYLFFERARGRGLGDADPVHDEHECGETKFVVEMILERGTDRVIYKDEVQPASSGIRSL